MSVKVYWASRVEDEFAEIQLHLAWEAKESCREGKAYVGSNSITIHFPDGNAVLYPYSSLDRIVFLKQGKGGNQR